MGPLLPSCASPTCYSYIQGSGSQTSALAGAYIAPIRRPRYYALTACSPSQVRVFLSLGSYPWWTASRHASVLNTHHTCYFGPHIIISHIEFNRFRAIFAYCQRQTSSGPDVHIILEQTSSSVHIVSSEFARTHKDSHKLEC